MRCRYKCLICISLPVFLVVILLLSEIYYTKLQARKQKIIRAKQKPKTLQVLLMGEILFFGPRSYDPGTEPQLGLDWKTNKMYKDADINFPLIIWWTPFFKSPRFVVNCDENIKCFATEDRRYIHYDKPKYIAYYGTDFRLEDVPLPRSPYNLWALAHEESPKNNYLFSHPEVMELFNSTCTFRKESDYSINSLYVRDFRDLETSAFLVSVSEKNMYRESGLALLNYVHSDCSAPSDRDALLKMLQKETEVDSMGRCSPNKQLPESLRDPVSGMNDYRFYEIMARYKFTLVTENSICNDYSTEKLWRTFMLGSVPVIHGAPNIRDYLPNNHSAILVSDFATAKDLVDYLKKLDQNDDLYNEYLTFKKDGVQNPYLRSLIKSRGFEPDGTDRGGSFMETYQCHLCKQLHDDYKAVEEGRPMKKRVATVEHYGCPGPVQFSNVPEGNLTLIPSQGHYYSYKHDAAMYEGKAFKQLVAEKGDFEMKELFARAKKLRFEETMKTDSAQEL